MGPIFFACWDLPQIVNCIDCHGKLGSSDHVLILANLNLSTVVPDNPQEVQD